MSETKFVQGIFKEELKNRFLCLVDVNGEDTLCYIPSSCRLSNFIDLRGKRVILTPVSTKNSRTKYSVYALCTGRQHVLLNMSLANKIVGNNIRNRRFSFLGSRKNVRKEYTVGNYKCDLYVEDTETVIEIKSILAFDKIAYFPTVYSQRAVEQLMKMNQLLDTGYKVCYIFISLNQKVRQLQINSDIDDYCKLFRVCMQKGMLLKGYSLCFKNEDITIRSELPVSVCPVETGTLFGDS